MTRWRNSKTPFVVWHENEHHLLRRLAAEECRTVKFWWCKKYGRPLKDPLLESYTLEELWLEYFTWLIDEDPNEEFAGLENTVVQFKTGDPEVDRIEEKLAKGEEVDLIKEWMDEADQEKFFKRYKKQDGSLKPTE